MATLGNLEINESHPLASELSSLRAAVNRFQDEAYNSSLKLQRHSLDAANAHDRAIHLERERDLLASELAILRAHPHPDASPQAHPAVLQVQQLTLSLRRLSDKLSLTEEALLERTTQLAHLTGEATKAKIAAEGAYELAARTRGREEAGKSRELELERKVRAAEEAMKMSDLVVKEYADLVRSLEAKAAARSTAEARSEPSSSSADEPNGSATLVGSLAEGKLGLQRLLSEFAAESEKLQTDLLRVQGELAASEAKRESEKKYAEQCRIELAQAQFELQQLKIDDNAAAKMVSRYMKFSQKSTDALQDALTALKTRHTATVDTLSAQLSHLSADLHFAHSQIQKLRQALDELGGEMMKETYGRRREVALRIRMVTREEKLREDLERWVLRAEEATWRGADVDVSQALDRMVRDARAVLGDTLGGTSSESDGSVARAMSAMYAVEMLREELERETGRRMELERVLAHQILEEALEAKPISNGDAVNHTPRLVSDDRSSSISLPVMPPAVLSDGPASSSPIVIDEVVSAPQKQEPSSRLKSLLPHEGPVSKPPPVSITITLEGVYRPPFDPSTGVSPEATSSSAASECVLETEQRPPSSSMDQSTAPVGMVSDGPPEQAVNVSTDTSLQRPLSGNKNINGSPAPVDDVPSSITEDLGSDLAPAVEPRLPGEGMSEASLQQEQDAGRQEEPGRPLACQSGGEHETSTSIPDRRDTHSPIPSPPPGSVFTHDSSTAPHTTPVVTHLDTPKPTPHPLLAELAKAEHRYDALQRALRDCHLALESLSESIPLTSDPRPGSGNVAPDVLRTALQRLKDYTEDARVELEIRVADEALAARGFETLLSVPGALALSSPSADQDEDTPSRSDIERQVEEFVSGTDPGVEKALRNLSRKLDDIQHDIAVLKRAVHDEVAAPSPPATAPATNGGWASWIRSPPVSASPASPASGLGSAGGPAPTFGNVMTTPRLRHSPSLNLYGSLGRRVPSEAAQDPLASLGLRVPMPSYVHHAHPAHQPLPQPRSRTLSTMYMLGLGARRPSGPLAPSASPMTAGPPPSLRVDDEATESEETDVDDDEDDTDVE
ncbi:hypothetical protein LshimejAT787_0200420 [Lyophyllum shimeji]|uniref:Uncharacterized protein n=1 Tax=Lyophyllum shimeji TaxID=47721 RepID=A0A9P3PEI8_LYOSH|nr:hypothetical protein LshimejAT787_0200420 [Lyophyllum shimeji]